MPKVASNLLFVVFANSSVIKIVVHKSGNGKIHIKPLLQHNKIIYYSQVCCIFNTHHFKNTKSNLNFETIYSNAFMHLNPQLVTNGKKLGKYLPHVCQEKLPPVLTDYSHCTFTKNNRIVVQIIQNQLIIASTHLCGENLFLMFILIWSQI